MTTFQAIIYAIIHGMSTFLPISPKAHDILIPYIVGWQAPSGALLGALSLGSLLAVFIYFRHDWASMISCFLQVIIYRKRPMTLDERLPLFICASTLPVLLASYYFHDRIAETDWTPLLVCAVLAGASVPLWMCEYIGRKTKGMFDWNGLDASFVGFIQASALIPGWDPMSGVLSAALFLNYKRESAVKYAFFASAPLLLARTISHLKGVSIHNPYPMPELSWLSFAIAIVVTCLVGLLAIGGFMKHIQQKGLGQYIAYRWVLSIGVVALYWFRNRG